MSKPTSPQNREPAVSAERKPVVLSVKPASEEDLEDVSLGIQSIVESESQDAGIPDAPATLPADAAPATRSMSAEILPVDQGDRLELIDVTVKKGDSLARIFNRAGLGDEVLARILQVEAKHKLRRIHPGDELSLMLTADGVLDTLRYRLDPLTELVIKRDGETYTSSTETTPTEKRVAHSRGEIRSSLFGAAAKAGLTDTQIMNLAEIFAWDVDFALDLRKGDRFTVVYEEILKDGERIATGDILAAEFVNDGHVHQAVRYQDANGRTGYYAPDGRPMRKAFLRNPVKFSRISSHFSLKRWHPKLHRFRAHKGTDYAARTGTPIRAAGDGKVIFAGQKGGYGRVVIISHGSRYTTLYAHLSRFAKGIRKGKRVNQGQMIGRVGQSGLATGPHLHYEFRVDGAHRDPLRVKLPGSPRLPKSVMADFESKTAGHLEALKSLTSTQLAQKD
ncbi:MAG: peptidoglycan DD-metalloendopeptidase family protein [Gammaproteobacteria bacterium]